MISDIQQHRDFFKLTMKYALCTTLGVTNRNATYPHVRYNHRKT